VAQIVQPVPDTGGAAGGPPGPRDGGRVGGLVPIAPSGEQPTVRVLALGPVRDMPGQHRHQSVRDVHSAFRAVLGAADLHLPVVGPLDLPASPKSKPLAEVRINDECVGQLTPQMSLRYLPMIRRLTERKLLTVSRGDIVGSAVAAEVRINGIKANEVDNDFLDVGIAQIPTLITEERDPRNYDLSKMLTLLQPLAPVPLPPPPPEPLDGSVVRFDTGRYNYVAVRRGDRWETSATQDWGIVNESMTWQEIATPARKFERATGWTAVDPRNDPRVRQRLAVVRFLVSDHYLAAVNIARDGSYEGDWYTTVTQQAERHLPIGDCPSWSQISHFGHSIEIPTGWEPVQ
jgi:hypothetical protein